ncbi:MAG: hypothetical protein M3417_13650 [Actinomycetota bacterium]|nr:hypothetical protein [Actinomycetota bacterium]
MATLEREIERPAFLEPPAEGQLSFGGVAAPPPERTSAREAGPAHESLLKRLRTERVAGAGAGAGAASTEVVAPRGGEATLDELLVGAWEGLSAHRPVACPICTEPMLACAGPAGGDCGTCGSRLR